MVLFALMYLYYYLLLTIKHLCEIKFWGRQNSVTGLSEKRCWDTANIPLHLFSDAIMPMESVGIYTWGQSLKTCLKFCSVFPGLTYCVHRKQ